MTVERHRRTIATRINDAVHARTGDSIAKLAAVSTGLILLAAAFAIGTVIRVNGLSGLDEITHIDWVYRILHNGLPADGDIISPQVLSIWACAGQWNAGLPPCGQPVAFPDFPYNGLQYNSFHPPLYYAVTAAIVGSATSLFAGADFVVVAQLASSLWLAAAMVLLYVALRSWRVSTVYALLAAALLLTMPRTLTAATMVTNDAPAVLGGVYVVFWLSRFRISRVRYLLLPSLLVVLLSATKTLNALPLVAVAVCLGILALRSAFQRQGRSTWIRLRAALVLIVPAAALYLIWADIQGARRIDGYQNPVGSVHAVALTENPLVAWAPSIANGFSLLNEINLVPEMRSTLWTTWNSWMEVLLTAAGFLVVLMYRRGQPRRWLGIVLLTGCLLYPVMVQVQVFGSGIAPQYFPTMSSRYGMSLIPVALGCLAFVVDTRGLRRTSILMVGTGLLIAGGSAFGYLAG